MVRKTRLELRRESKYNPYATLHYRGVSLLFSIVFVIFIWHRALDHHFNLAFTPSAPQSRFPDRHFLGFLRVCALSICTSGIPGEPGKSTVWKPDDGGLRPRE